MKLSTSQSQDGASSSHLHALLDVFEVFLDTDNPLVFSNAAVDCILCLLKHVRGPSKFNFHESLGTVYQILTTVSDMSV